MRNGLAAMLVALTWAAATSDTPAQEARILSGALAAWQGSPPCFDVIDLPRSGTRWQAICPGADTTTTLLPTGVRVQCITKGGLVLSDVGASAQVVVEFTSPTTVAGILIVRGFLGPIAWDNADSMSMRVDVGTDDQPELDLQSSGTFETSASELPIVLTSRGVRVGIQTRIDQGHYLTLVSGGSASVEVTFLPTPTAMTTFLPPCLAQLQGFVHEVDQTTTRFHFEGHTTAMHDCHVFVFGTSRTMRTIPPLGCLLGTDVLLPVPIPASGGDSVLDLTASVPIHGTIQVQLLVGQFQSGPAIWGSSNLLELTFP